MGIAPKSVDEYYPEEAPRVGWSSNPVNLQGGYSTPAARPYFLDPQAERLRATEQMAQQYQFNRLQNELEGLPQAQRLEEIERKERLKSGLERLQMMGQKEQFQNRIQKGEIDYYTPEGRREMAKALGMGIVTPSTINAIRAASPKAEALSEAVYNLNGIDLDSPDAPTALQQVLNSTDKSIHLEPEFRYAVRDAQNAIAKRQAENDKTLINRAFESGMADEEVIKHLNPEMTRVMDKAGFMKAYTNHLKTERAKKNIFTPEWQKRDAEMEMQSMERAERDPSPYEIENVLRMNPANENRDFTDHPATPEEIAAATTQWRTEPSKKLNFHRRAAQSLLNAALGITPQAQESAAPVNDARAKALDLIKRNVGGM